MLKSLQEILYTVLDYILPVRKNFSLVKDLSAEKIYSLPKAPRVEGFDWINPLFHYKNRVVRAIVWELKYRENTLPLEYVGKMLYEEIIDAISNISMFDSDAEFVLLPIPITEERRIERGYNQSELISRSIIEHDFTHSLLYAPQWFTKIRETERQSHSKSKNERIHNLVGCFSADERIFGKHIVLIDDVVTTGSTLNEARKTLLRAGAKSVLAFTIAH